MTDGWGGNETDTKSIKWAQSFGCQANVQTFDLKPSNDSVVEF